MPDALRATGVWGMGIGDARMPHGAALAGGSGDLGDFDHFAAFVGAAGWADDVGGDG